MRRLAAISASLWLLLLSFISIKAFAQLGNVSSNSNYHNRIEYQNFHWQVFHTPSFHLYFPRGANSLSAFIARELLPAKSLIQKRMGGNAATPAAIIIYPSLGSQYESSIGSRETQPLTVPTFVGKGSRMVLHYDGSYKDLKDQLYTGLSRVAWEKEIEQNSSIGNQVKGAIKSEPLPYWFKEGAIRYFAVGWTISQEESFRRILLADSPGSFYFLAAYYPAQTGAAFCYYLSLQQREDAPKQLLYQLRKGKSLDRALRLVCKQPADSLYRACFDWYRQRFNGSTRAEIGLFTKQDSSNNDNETQSEEAISNASIKLLKRVAKKGTVNNYQLDPSGKNLAFTVSFPTHSRSVYIASLKERSASNASDVHRVCTYQLPPWMKDHKADQFPILNWTAQGSELLVVYPQKGKLTVSHISAGGNIIRKTALPFIDGLSSIRSLGSDRYLLTAWVHGQSDLVIYDANKEKYLPVINDVPDDGEPAISPENGATVSSPDQQNAIAAKPIYFSSSRKGDTAFGQDSLHVYHGIYRVASSKVMPVLTDTNVFTSYTNPILIDDKHLLLLATIKGKTSLALLDLNHAQDAKEQSTAKDLLLLGGSLYPYQYASNTRRITFFRREKDSIEVVSGSIDQWIENAKANAIADTMLSPWLLDYQARITAKQKEDSILRAARDAGGSSFLEGIFSSMNKDKRGGKDAKSDSSAYQYTPAKAKPYVLQLYSAYFFAKVNNDYFINRYQPYRAFQGSFKFPEVGGMVQGGLSDLFEHHNLSIAYRLPAGSEGSMFFTKYSNTAKRLDWSLAYYRNVESLHPDPDRAWVDEDGRHYPNTAKVKTHYYELGLSYPLSNYSTIGGNIFFRKDRTVFLATDLYSLTFPALTEMWAGIPLWLESKHLRPTLSNLHRGWEGSVATDVFKSFSGKETFVGAINLSAQWHQPIYKYITLVVKGQAAYSGGDRKVLYNLGGVDNSLTPRIDSTVHFRQSAPYAFQKLVTPFRGYLQNSLYGSRYALLNADVYFPLFESLIPIETAFPSINQLQVGLFVDVARAGGDTRYTTAEKGWLYSYGFSARTKLAGYPLRFDIGWPGRFSNAPVWYLSLNLL